MNCSFLKSSHVQIAIYDDRLEITSPGGLMPGVTIERMKEGYSQIRNRALAHAFSYMNLIEGWGTGIPRLIHEMKEYGLKEPEFIDMEIAMRINLYRASTDVKISNNEEISNHTGEEIRINEETSEETNKETNKEITNREKILCEIYGSPDITQKQLAEKIGLSYAGVRYIMNQLQNEGIIERVGSTKKGQWVIKNR